MLEDYDLKAFGQRMKFARDQKGISQMELAEAVGASAGSIPGYENGLTDPRLSIVPKIATALGVSFAWLANGERVVDLGTDPDRAKKILEYIDFLDSKMKNNAL